MEFQFFNPITQELSKKDFITIPTTIKNKVIMAPGFWNGTHYTSHEIQRAFENTDWKDKDICSLILDHSDKPLSVHDWVGWVKNPRMIGENLVGDLELFDENVLVKLVRAKAKFGISPRVKGLEHNDNLRNFTFENFSIVTNPAVKKAYINLSQKNMKGGKMTEELQEETEESVEEEAESSEEEEQPEEAEETEEEASKEMRKKKYPYPYKEKKKSTLIKKKKKYPYPEEEMSDEELETITTNSAWTDFVKKMKKKYPKMKFKDIAKAFRKTKKTSEELEELSDEELVDRIEELTSILRRRKKYKPEEEEMTETEKKLSQEIKDLKERIDEPNAISIQQTHELSSSPQVVSIYDEEDKHHSPGVLAMADFLGKIK